MDNPINGYANFYQGDKCLFSVLCNGISEAENLADKEYSYGDKRVDDWTYTETPMSKKVLN